MAGPFNSWAHRRMGPQSPVEHLPPEVLERICQLLPASAKTQACLALVRTSKLWYGPAIRELFASVVLENEEHTQGVLSTLAADVKNNGILAQTVRKLCLIVGDEESRKPPSPTIPTPAVNNPHPHHGAGLPHLPAHLHAMLPPHLLHLFHGLGHGNGNGNHGLHAPPVATFAQQQALLFLHMQQQQQAQHQQQQQQAQQLQAALPPAPHLPPQQHPQQQLALPPPPPAAVATGDPVEPEPAPVNLHHVEQAEVSNVLHGTSPLHRSYEEDEEESAEQDISPPKTPLELSSALAVLTQTVCIQSLTIHLPANTPLDEETLDALSNLRLLRRLVLAGKLNFGQLWHLLTNLPCLEELFITGLSDGEDVDLDEYTDQFENTTLHLRSLSFYRTEMRPELFQGLSSCSKDTLTSLRLSRFVIAGRLSFKNTLRLIGGNLRRLAIHRLLFRGLPPTAQETHLVNLLDDLPTYCPMLEELQVAAERIVSPVRFLSVIIPSLFLTTLELDYSYPLVSESQILELVTKLPAGRLETISFGPKMSHLSTGDVRRAFQEIGVVVLAACETDYV